MRSKKRWTPSVSFIFLGALNLAALKKKDRFTGIAALAANCLCLAFSILIVLVLPEIQAFAAVLVLAAAAAGSVRSLSA